MLGNGMPRKRQKNGKPRGGQRTRFKPGNRAAVGHGRPKVPEEYKAAITMLEPIALDVLGQILADPRHPRRQQTAEYIINRKRGTPTNRTEVTGPNGEAIKVTYDDVRQKLTAMAERAVNAGNGTPPNKD